MDGAGTDIEHDVHAAEFITVYHLKKSFRIYMKKAAKRRRFLNFELLRVLLRVLALLVCNAAARLASRLAGSLALAAAAVLCAFAQVAGLKRLNVFHIISPPNCYFIS